MYAVNTTDCLFFWTYWNNSNAPKNLLAQCFFLIINGPFSSKNQGLM